MPEFDREAETAALLAELEAAGLLVVEGDEVRLTEQGARVGRMLAMAGDEESVLLEALLEGRRESE